MTLPDRLNLGALVDCRGAADRTALVCDGGAISFGMLGRATDAIAHAVHAGELRGSRLVVAASGSSTRGRGRRGRRIAIVSGNRPEFIAIMFGAMRAGCTVVPINPRQSIDITLEVLDEIEPALVFVERAIRAALPPEMPCVEIESLGLDLASGSGDPHNGAGASTQPTDRFDATPVDDDARAEILFTSGSTGRPRGVPLTHRGQVWFLNTFLDATGWSPEIALVAAPLFHMNALIRVKCALATGGQVVLQRSFSPEAYLQAIEDHRVTLLTGVPTMYAILLERRDLLRRIDTSSVTRLMLGSGAASPDLVDALRQAFPKATIGIAYGLTEAGGTVSSTLVPADGATPPRGSVGRPLPGVELRFGERDGEANQGVLHLRSPALATGYFKRPEQTADRFHDGWLKTNDVLRRDDAGWLYFLGRADDMYVCGGENVYPAQIEARLLGHPQVAQAAVVAVPDRIKGQVAFAFVVLRGSCSISPSGLQAHLAAGAPSHLHAHHLRLLEAMPLNSANKVDLAHLRRMAIELST